MARRAFPSPWSVALAWALALSAACSDANPLAPSRTPPWLELEVAGIRVAAGDTADLTLTNESRRAVTYGVGLCEAALERRWALGWEPVPLEPDPAHDCSFRTGLGANASVTRRVALPSDAAGGIHRFRVPVVWAEDADPLDLISNEFRVDPAP